MPAQFLLIPASFVPTARAHLLRALYEGACPDELSERSQVQRMKKYMNYVGLGVDPEGAFLHQIRRVTARSEFFKICEQFLHHDAPMSLEPFRLSLNVADLLAGEHR